MILQKRLKIVQLFGLDGSALWTFTIRTSVPSVMNSLVFKI